MIANVLIKHAKQVIAFVVSFVMLTMPLIVDSAQRGEIAEITRNPLVLRDNFTVTAHSGAMYLPDNSRIALLAAVKGGYDVVEMDISYRPDGTPVIIHNAEPTQWQGVLLDEALAIVALSDTTQINLDNKSTANLPELYRLIVKHGLENRAFFTGVNESSIELINANCPLPYYLNCSINEDLRDDSAYAQQLAARVKAGGFVGINCNYIQMSKTVVDAMHENDLLVSVWTVNTNIDLYRMLALSVDNITTRRPYKLQLIIDTWQ